MNVYEWLKTLMGSSPKKPRLKDFQCLDSWALRYVEIEPLSGLCRAEARGRQTAGVITLSSFDGAPPQTTEWVLLPYEWFDLEETSAAHVGQDVNLPADVRTSYGGTSDG